MSSLVGNAVDFIGGHPLLAIVVVFLAAAGEAVFVVGLFVPSTAVLIGAGTLIGMGRLSFLPIFIASCVGATAGDGISYWAGHIYKERLKQIWPFSKYRGLIDGGERFFIRHGGKSVFIGRFVPGVKAVVPGIAGMMGMSVGRFTAINAVSAVAWSAAHILPAMGFGRGISIFGSGNPRLIALIAIVVVVMLVAWYAAKLSIVWLGPGFGRLYHASVARLAASRATPLRFVHRVLTNEDEIITPVIWSAVGLLAVFGFAALLLNLLFEPELAAADHAISNFVQSLRSGPADSVMVAITMMGDSLVLTTLAVGLIAILAVYRRWRVAGVAVLGIVSAAAFVPLVKSILQRPRPIGLYAGSEAFSFPSGHATLSMTILGLIAVILAHGRSTRLRLAVYGVTVTVVGMIAFSRIYLRAHWPSDVAAGLLFGVAIVSVIAFFLHHRAAWLPVRRIAATLGLIFMVAYPIDLARNYAASAAIYAIKPQPLSTTTAAWLGSGWQTLPARRVQLDGETGEPFVIQTDVTKERLATLLQIVGWRAFPTASFTDDLSALLPSRSPFTDQPPLPYFHDGHPAGLILAKASPSGPDTRFVLRFWSSGTEVALPAMAAPVLLGSITAEAQDPFALGLAGVEPTDMSKAERSALVAELVGAFGAEPTIHLASPSKELLLISTR